MRRRLTLVAPLCALWFALPATAAQPPSAEQYYARAIEAMRNLPQPNYVTYDVHVHTTGVGFLLTDKPNGKASVDLGIGDRRAKRDADFHAAYRKNGGLTSVQTPDGAWGVIDSPIFDPTWTGVDDWIRYGMSGAPASATARFSPAPEFSGLPVIAAVSAMGLAYYNATDSGAATCANGDPGHRVHLIARKDPLDHPLTDAVIDMRTNRLCSVHFAMRQSVVAAGYTGTIELNLDDVGGTSLIRSGTFDFMIRALGIGVKHIAMTFAYDNFAFPKLGSDAIFPKGS